MRGAGVQETGGAADEPVGGGEVDGGGEPQVRAVHGLPLQDLRLEGEAQVRHFPPRSERIFKTLSDFLVTRTPRQCRSHFQKIINKFKKLRKVRLHYQEQLGTAVYTHRLEELSRQLREQKVKLEESERTCAASFTEVAIQTDPMQLSLCDLSNVELMKLMNLLNECQKIQLPQWMPPLPRPQLG